MFAKVVVYFLVAFATQKWVVCVIFVSRAAPAHPKRLLYFGQRQLPKILAMLIQPCHIKPIKTSILRQDYLFLLQHKSSPRLLL